jgi:tartrate dehydrogenase/decarboxylase / D-malate dehydrogenase
MFEPIHGSAFDITGMGIGECTRNLPINAEDANNHVANPVATFWTAVEMLKWLGQEQAGDALLEVVETVCENGIMTKDLGGSATTVEVTNAVCDEIQRTLGKRS